MRLKCLSKAINFNRFAVQQDKIISSFYSQQNWYEQKWTALSWKNAWRILEQIRSSSVRLFSKRENCWAKKSFAILKFIISGKFVVSKVSQNFFLNLKTFHNYEFMKNFIASDGGRLSFTSRASALLREVTRLSLNVFPSEYWKTNAGAFLEAAV